MNPHYYLMKNKKILRLEAGNCFDSLPVAVKEKAFLTDELIRMNQEQANWRVVLFRDEIMEMDEYQEWLSSPEAMMEEEHEYELAAN